MKLLIIFLVTLFSVIGCQTASTREGAVSTKQVIDNSTTKEATAAYASISAIDFQNFTFPWTKTFGYGEKSFTLKNGNADLPDERNLSLRSLADKKQVRDLADRLRKFEKKHDLPLGTIGIELMIETPESIIGRKGNFVLKELIAAGKGRVTSAHFGAYDYTAALGISAADQHIRHEACNFARQMMLINLAPLGIRLVDSVTTKLPVAIYSGRLNQQQKLENHRSIHAGWAEHFDNITESMRGGFYQSWDLHPNQLPARYAAVYSYFLTGMDSQAERLKAFIERATKATLSGNTFDDAASAQGILNFFVRGMDCSAFSEKEAAAATGLSPSELRSSFQSIAAK